MRKKVTLDDYTIYSLGKNKYMVQGESKNCPSKLTTFVSFDTAKQLTGKSEFPKWVVSEKKKKEAIEKKKRKQERKIKKKEAEKKAKERAKKKSKK